MIIIYFLKSSINTLKRSRNAAHCTRMLRVHANRKKGNVFYSGTAYGIANRIAVTPVVNR